MKETVASVKPESVKLERKLPTGEELADPKEKSKPAGVASVPEPNLEDIKAENGKLADEVDELVEKLAKSNEDVAILKSELKASRNDAVLFSNELDEARKKLADFKPSDSTEEIDGLKRKIKEQADLLEEAKEFMELKSKYKRLRKRFKRLRYYGE